MYWGSSNVYPIFRAELDKTRKLTYKSDYKGLIYLDPKNRGWESFGRHHLDNIRPFTDGARMTKHGGNISFNTALLALNIMFMRMEPILVIIRPNLLIRPI